MSAPKVDLSAAWLAERMGYVAPMSVHEDWTADEVREHALLIAASLPQDPPNVCAARREVLRTLRGTA